MEFQGAKYFPSPDGLRIIPVCAFTVLLYFFAVHAAHDPLKISQFSAALPWLVSFLQEFRPASTGTVFGHAWTLGIEEKFYIAWPLLLLALNPIRIRAAIGLAMIYLALLFLPHMYARSYDGLLTGAILAVGLSSRLGSAISHRLTRIPDAALCALIALTYAINGFTDRYVLLFSGAVALFVGTLVLWRGVLRRVLEAAPLVFIGRRSYAMYLVHVLVLKLSKNSSPSQCVTALS